MSVIFCSRQNVIIYLKIMNENKISLIDSSITWPKNIFVWRQLNWVRFDSCTNWNDRFSKFNFRKNRMSTIAASERSSSHLWNRFSTFFFSFLLQTHERLKLKFLTVLFVSVRLMFFFRIRMTHNSTKIAQHKFLFRQRRENKRVNVAAIDVFCWTSKCKRND